MAELKEQETNDKGSITHRIWTESDEVDGASQGIEVP
jgi:hypothetical protein